LGPGAKDVTGSQLTFSSVCGIDIGFVTTKARECSSAELKISFCCE